LTSHRHTSENCGSRVRQQITNDTARTLATGTAANRGNNCVITNTDAQKTPPTASNGQLHVMSVWFPDSRDARFPFASIHLLQMARYQPFNESDFFARFIKEKAIHIDLK
jgi:hypothetical protein